MTNMFHGTYEEMDTLLDQITFGLAKNHQFSVPVDDPQDHTPGVGFLMDDKDCHWLLMKHIMDTPDLFQRYFDTTGEDLKLMDGPNQKWLNDIARFKELFYIVIHCLCGMPKRGSEEERLRVINTTFRQRNFMWMFNRMSFVGSYSKTGVDKTTLHFLPPAFERLLRVYFSFAAVHEAYLNEKLLGQKDHEYMAYFLSSKGKRFPQEKKSLILRTATKKHLGEKFGIRSLRHILPGIAEHYNIGRVSNAEGNSVAHSQLGHDKNTGLRWYARSTDIHQQLSSEFCHDTIDFCNHWAKLWGFETPVPSLSSALRRQQLFEAQFGNWNEPSPSMQAETESIQLKLDQVTEMLKSVLNQAQENHIAPSPLISSCPEAPITPSQTSSVPPVYTTGEQQTLTQYALNEVSTGSSAQPQSIVQVAQHPPSKTVPEVLIPPSQTPSVSSVSTVGPGPEKPKRKRTGTLPSEQPTLPANVHARGSGGETLGSNLHKCARNRVSLENSETPSQVLPVRSPIEPSTSLGIQEGSRTPVASHPLVVPIVCIFFLNSLYTDIIFYRYL